MSQFTTDVDGHFDVTEITELNRVHRTSALKKACSKNCTQTDNLGH